MVLDNQSGASFRADLNNALQAVASNQSGSSAPSPTTYPYQFWADTGAGVLRMRNAANTGWVTIGLLGVANFGHCAPGDIVFHAKNAAPPGFLKANGAAVSRTTYADLFAEIGITFGSGDGSTTFNLPEMRGEFPRAWDDSRGIDSGRVFGSAQTGSVESHRHNFRANFNGAGTSGSIAQYGASGQSEGPQLQTEVTGGSETRPRNIALLACIKY
jgi:phage-related tail fiber protein